MQLSLRYPQLFMSIGISTCGRERKECIFFLDQRSQDGREGPACYHNSYKSWPKWSCRCQPASTEQGLAPSLRSPQFPDSCLAEGMPAPKAIFRPVVLGEAVATLVLIENSQAIVQNWSDLHDHHLPTLLGTMRLANPIVPVSRQGVDY